MPRALRGLDGVENHRGGIAAFLGDDRHVVALAPDLQLFARRGAEGVAGGQQHRLALRLEMLGQLADGGGLAGAVDAGQHDDEGLVRGDVERLLQRRQQSSRPSLQRLLELGGFGQLVALDAASQVVEQGLGRIDADIGGDQDGFQFFVQLVIDLAAARTGSDSWLPSWSRVLASPCFSRCCPAQRARSVAVRRMFLSDFLKPNLSMGSVVGS